MVCRAQAICKMDKELYRKATAAMEEAGVDPDYIIGWQGGFLGHPLREEQRATDAYSAGHADGLAQNGDNYKSWIKK